MTIAIPLAIFGLVGFFIGCFFFATKIRRHVFDLNSETNLFSIAHQSSLIAKCACVASEEYHMPLSEIATFEILKEYNGENKPPFLKFKVTLKNQFEYPSGIIMPYETLVRIGDYIGLYQKSIGNLGFQRIEGKMIWMSSNNLQTAPSSSVASSSLLSRQSPTQNLVLPKEKEREGGSEGGGGGEESGGEEEKKD